MDHSWDAFKVLDIQRDRRCVGYAPSKGRECHNTVNAADMNIFYTRLTSLSSQPMDATSLEPSLPQLASLGLCKLHRHGQKDNMVAAWTKKITAAARQAQIHVDIEVESYYSRNDTRSSTASAASTRTLSSPRSQRMRSSTETVSTDTSITAIIATAQDEIASLLRCLQAAEEQRRVMMRRLGELQTTTTPRPRQITQGTTPSAPSSRASDRSDEPSSRTSRGRGSTSHRSSTRSSSVSSSSSSSSSSDESSSPSHTLPPLEHLHRSPISSPRSSSASSTSSRPLRSPSPTPRSTPASSASPPPRQSNCTTSHVRRRPVAAECPVCYESMREGEEPLQWCKTGCGQSVHGVCMDAWICSLVEGENEASCVLCRDSWEGCEC